MTDQELNEEETLKVEAEPELFDPATFALPVSLLEGESGRVIKQSLRLYTKAKALLTKEEARAAKQLDKANTAIAKAQKVLDDKSKAAEEAYEAEVTEVIQPLRKRVLAASEAIAELLTTAKEEPVGKVPAALEEFKKPRNTKAKQEEQELVDGDDS